MTCELYNTTLNNIYCFKPQFSCFNASSNISSHLIFQMDTFCRSLVKGIQHTCFFQKKKKRDLSNYEALKNRLLMHIQILMVLISFNNLPWDYWLSFKAQIAESSFLHLFWPWSGHPVTFFFFFDFQKCVSFDFETFPDKQELVFNQVPL